MKIAGTERRSISRLGILRRWVVGHLGSSAHERRVASIAASLVQLTAPLHSLGKSDIRLLKMAAMVHDVGRCISKKRHASIGARMVHRGKGLPLKNRQRRILAYLTRHHRGQVPEYSGEHKFLRPMDDLDRMRLLLAFLRAADALDGRSISPPELSFQIHGRKLRITCRLSRHSTKGRRYFSRRKKFRLLEEMLNCRIEVNIETGRKLRLVA